MISDTPACVIKSFADKRAAAPFTGHYVKQFPNQIQPRAMAKLRMPDAAPGRRLPPIHPGEILRAEFLRPMGISVYALAQAIRVQRSRVNDIVLRRRGITADTALRLARYFGTTPEFWVNLQAH